jgi:uncharacterized glyoxalase superfamily protein PhnB
MASVVDLAVANPAEAAEYYESLLAVTPEGKPGNDISLSGDHLRVNLRKGNTSPAEITLNVTPGMLARILDAAMKWQCEITVGAPEQVKLTDRYARSWTLRCQVS